MTSVLRALGVLLVTGTVIGSRPTAAAGGQCVGDCNADDRVTSDELLGWTAAALGVLPGGSCASIDAGPSQPVMVVALLRAVDNALNTCNHVHLEVDATDGTAVNGFSARFSELGDRVRTDTAVDTDTGDVVAYPVQDVNAQLFVEVMKPGYHLATTLLDADPSADDRHVRIELVDVRQCIDVSPQCRGTQPSGMLVPGEVAVGFADSLLTDDARAVLDRYCVVLDQFGNRYKMVMCVDLSQVDYAATVKTLEAQAIVQSVRPNVPCEGGTVTVGVVFNFDVPVTAGTALINSLPGVRWLETFQFGPSASLLVEPGAEADWACTLGTDPALEYATPNYID